jgi:polyhydroxyalkanoate synthesis regulator phasin
MVLDGLKAYVQLANGLTDVTRERAMNAARALVAQGEAGIDVVLPDAMRAQVSSLTDDLMATSRANRDLMVGLVRAEVERSVARLGLVSAAELGAATSRAERLDDRVHELERALRSARSSSPRSGTKKAGTKKASTKKATAKKSAAKKSTAKKSTAKKSTTKKTTAKKSTAKKSTTKKATAKKSAANKSTAKKTTAKRTTAKRSASKRSGSGSSGARRSTARTSTSKKSSSSGTAG